MFLHKLKLLRSLLKEDLKSFNLNFKNERPILNSIQN